MGPGSDNKFRVQGPGSLKGNMAVDPPEPLRNRDIFCWSWPAGGWATQVDSKQTTSARTNPKP